MGEGLWAKVPLAITECANCFMPFGLPEKLRDKRLEDGEVFWCPNGHENFFPFGRDQKKRDKERAEQERKREIEGVWWENEMMIAINRMPHVVNGSGLFLFRAGIREPIDLAQYTEPDLLDIDGIGPGTIKGIKTYLSEIGMELSNGEG